MVKCTVKLSALITPLVAGFNKGASRSVVGSGMLMLIECFNPSGSGENLVIDS